MTIASFTVPERDESSVSSARERLGRVGVASYVVELAGSGAPVLDVNEVTYVGEEAISAAIAELEAARR